MSFEPGREGSPEAKAEEIMNSSDETLDDLQGTELPEDDDDFEDENDEIDADFEDAED